MTATMAIEFFLFVNKWIPLLKMWTDLKKKSFYILEILQSFLCKCQVVQ